MRDTRAEVLKRDDPLPPAAMLPAMPDKVAGRTVAVGATGLVLAPAVVRAEVLMRLRGVIVPPIEPVYYGFLERLRLYTEQHRAAIYETESAAMLDDNILRGTPCR
jgi:hypothetical protein